MKRFTGFLTTAAGVVVLSSAISLTGLGSAAASSLRASVQRVLITNGTIKVAGTVKVDPSGNSVQVSSIAPTQPVTFTASVAVKPGTGDDSATAYTVPAGKRLVIEFASIDYEEQFSDDFVRAGVRVGAGPLFVLPLSHVVGRGTGYDFHLIAGQDVKLYANGGDIVSIHIVHDTLLEASNANFSFSGYLVNS
jgi:hypothetical protein